LATDPNPDRAADALLSGTALTGVWQATADEFKLWAEANAKKTQAEWWQAGLPVLVDPARPAPRSRSRALGDWVLTNAPDGDSADPGTSIARLYADGWDRVAVSRRLDRRRAMYTLGRRSDFVPRFHLPAIFDALNAADPACAVSDDRWGGGSTIGGSPRTGSRLAERELIEIVERVRGAS
jgi:hypothetical protein